MARRYSGRMNGERYLANTSASKREVHDLDNEKTGPNQCQIDEIIRARNEKPYNDLNSAHRDGFDDCAYCLPNSRR